MRRYIENEADLDASTNPSGLTALALAVYRGNYEIAALLVAIQSGEMPMIQALIKGGADINYPGEVNIPPLVAAISRGNLALAQ